MTEISPECADCIRLPEARPTRQLVSADDLSVSLTSLHELFDGLDRIVAVNATSGQPYRGGNRTAKSLRFGSVAGSSQQVDFYFRVATNPAIKTVCEVGFNVGHSAALWLSAHPTLHVVSFDVFRLEPRLGGRYGVRTARALQRRFPGRLTWHMGNSHKSVPKWVTAERDSGRRCDLVHIDGLHSYTGVILDFLNLWPMCTQETVFLFDDQCDPRNCTAQNRMTSLACAEATCDLVAASLLQPVVAFHHGARQFAMFRAHPRASDKEVAPVAEFHPESNITHWYMPCAAKTCSTCSRRDGPVVPPTVKHCGLPQNLHNGFDLRPEIARLRSPSCPAVPA